MRHDEYWNDLRINASKLKCFAGRDYDPAIALHKAKTPFTPKPSMELGTAVHGIVELCGDIPGDVITCPFDSYRTKEAKQWREDHAGHIILSDDDMEKAKRMAARILNDTPKDIRDMILSPNANREKAFFNNDLKALMDLELYAHAIDYKTTSATSPQQFEREIAKYHYHLQAEHYRITGGLLEFAFVAVSSVEPHPVWTFRCDASFFEWGRFEWHRAYKRMMQALEGIQTHDAILKSPPWAREDNNEVW